MSGKREFWMNEIGFRMNENGALLLGVRLMICIEISVANNQAQNLKPNKSRKIFARKPKSLGLSVSMASKLIAEPWGNAT